MGPISHSHTHKTHSPTMSESNNSDKTILVTGGTGYIGSHTVLQLLKADYSVVVVDNLSNSSQESLVRVEALAGKSATFVEGDLTDAALVDQVFADHDVYAVIHFAGLKAVGESVSQPLRYYENNLYSTLVLLKAMTKAGVTRIVFSSSATVYGIPTYLPIDEDHPLSCTNPYGRTKLFLEDIFRDLAVAQPSWNIILLRYFNPGGADPSGTIGEDPNGPPNNLMPYVTQTAIGRREILSVFGDDYDTVDGTGVRDYIHVLDLADGHLAALAKIEDFTCEAFNLGTGTGYSVLQIVEAMKKAAGKDIPYQVVDRRPGDVASCYATAEKAKTLLGWAATRTLDDICADAWRWQENNPSGFAPTSN